MITKEINCYEFKELPEKVQERILDKFRDVNVDYDDWCDLDYYSEQLEEFGVENAKIYYSGFWSQGDGACFESESIDILKWIKATKSQKQFPIIFHHLTRRDDLEVLGRFYHSGHYYHQYCMYLSFEFSYWGENTKVEDKIYEEAKELEEAILEWGRDKAQDIYYSLEKEYEYQTSDEAVIDFLENNEYLFDENGRIM